MPELERLDEVGAMARALLVLRDNSRDGVALRLDSLTGLANRKVLMDRLKQALAASARNEFYGGLILIDMDKFKALNDTQGHDVGNMLLRTVATRLTACVRAADIVARLGGDEFVVVVLDISRQEEEAAAALESVGEKVLAALARTYQLGHVVHTLTASIGLTLLKADAVSGEELLKQADLALYKSKETGRNACRFFDPIMEATVDERAALEPDLRHDIAGGQFCLHYQAQVDVDGRLNGAEALLRWDHPIRGLVQPLEFIALTEKTGLILPLGLWVLETACRQLACWAVRSDMADLKIAVNVSVRQFQRPYFVEEVQAILESTGADPHRLDLELTESLLVEDIDDVVQKILMLKASGVSFTLDDFGTGYSSLSHLKRLPLDQLKIDRTFVHDVLVDANDAAVGTTIVALANTLGLAVIAEGVETV